MSNDKIKEPIYLDQEGYNAFLQNVEKVKQQINENNMGRREAFESGAGDGWDSPEFEEIERINLRLHGELQRYYEELNRVVIVEKHNNEEIIDIGDRVVLDMIFAPDDSEEMTIKIVGGTTNIDADIQEISINSPLGKAVYKNKVGANCSYSVNNMEFNILIKEKVNLTNENDVPTKKIGR